MKRALIFSILCIICAIGAKAEAVKYSDWFFGTNAQFKFTIETRSDSVFLLVNMKSQDVQIRKDAKMLIKFNDGTIIKLTGERKESALIPSVSSLGSDISTTNFYFSVTEFPISKENIEKFKDGVKKIRINTSPEIYTKEWSKDKIGQKLYDQYSKIIGDSFEADF